MWFLSYHKTLSLSRVVSPHVIYTPAVHLRVTSYIIVSRSELPTPLLLLLSLERFNEEVGRGGRGGLVPVGKVILLSSEP